MALADAGRAERARLRLEKLVEVTIVVNCGLAVDPDGVPHPGHANIVGWPELRSAQKLVAINASGRAGALMTRETLLM